MVPPSGVPSMITGMGDKEKWFYFNPRCVIIPNLGQRIHVLASSRNLHPPIEPSFHFFKEDGKELSKGSVI